MKRCSRRSVPSKLTSIRVERRQDLLEDPASPDAGRALVDKLHFEALNDSVVASG